MENVTITGLEMNDRNKPTPSGNIILAYFSAKVGPFSFKGCQLVRTARQGIGAYLPRLDHPNQHNQRQVTLHDEPTRHALLKAARDMYITMGGKDADWRSRDDEETGYREASERKPLALQVTATRRRIERDEVDDRAGLETFLGSNEPNDLQADGGE